MFVTVRKDTEKVTISGIDQPESDLMSITETHLAIKVPGRTYRHNMRPGSFSEYLPTEIQIWEISDVADHGKILHIEADKILEFPVNKKKKQVKQGGCGA